MITEKQKQNLKCAVGLHKWGTVREGPPYSYSGEYTKDYQRPAVAIATFHRYCTNCSKSQEVDTDHPLVQQYLWGDKKGS